MKPIALLLIFAASLAAAPVVVIDNLESCTVDGKPAGAVVDAIANIPECRAAMLDALIAREKALTDTVAAKEADKAAAESARLAIIASTKAALADADAVKAKEAAVAVVAAAEVPEIEKRKAQLDAEILQKQAERAKLDEVNAMKIKSPSKAIPKLKKP